MKKESRFTVRGRIVEKEGQSGVFGLTVSLFDRDLLFDDRLGSAVTDEQGRFTVSYGERDFRDLFERAPDLYVRVIDCRGIELYSSDDAVRWNAGPEVDFAIELEQEAVAPHRELLRPLARLSGGLVATAKIAEIDRAAALLDVRIAEGAVTPGPAGGPPPRRPLVPLSASYCPAPDILLFDDLLDIAWGVMENDVLAVRRYVDVLETLIYRKDVRDPEQVAAASARWREERPADPEALAKIVAAKGATLPPASSETLIETDRLLPLLAAAVLVAGGDRATENRYLGVLLGQVNGLGQLDVVYRAARGALRSNPGGLGHLRGLLGHVGGTCGPDDGPLPWPPREDDFWWMEEMWRLEKWQCTAEMAIAVSSGALRAGRYTITAVDWGDGCPGDTVVITGENLSGIFPDSQRVIFCHRSGWGTVEVAAADPHDWTNTRIEITLPAEAGPGPVSLSILHSFATACGRAILVPRRGNEVEFTGGSAYIRVFTANDRRGEFRIDPGESVTLRWLVVPADADVRLEVRQDGALLSDGPVAVEGDMAVAIPAGQPSDTVCTLVAESDCPGEDRRTITMHARQDAALEIVGIEVTQATQFYRAADHLTDPSDQEPDNSVQLVVGKPALVRAYLRSGVDPGYNGGDLLNVTGTLRVERLSGATPVLVATIGSTPTGIGRTAHADFATYDAERSDITSTVNFVIPARHMEGRLQLTIEVSAPSDWFDGAEASADTTVDVLLEQTLQVAGIMVGYNGPPVLSPPPGTPNLVLAAPGLADLQATGAWPLTVFPVRSDSVTTFRVAGTIVQTVPLTDPMTPGSCTVNWDALMGDLRAAAAADGNLPDWVYYGLLATGIPMGPVVGCGGGGVGTGGTGAGETMGEEIGHALGLRHAPACGAGRPDPNYPAYEPYDPAGTATASIGEYGFEFTGLMTIHRPAVKDFMSYCAPCWVSPYHYRRLLNVGRLTPTPVAPAMASAASGEPQPLINLLAFLDPDDTVRVHSVSRLVTGPQVVGGTPTELVVELLDDDGAVLAAAPAYSVRLETPDDRFCEYGRCSLMLQALVPNPGRGALLRIRRGKAVLWQRQAPAVAVAVKDVRADLDQYGRLHIAWQAEADPAVETRATVRWSVDRGKSWRCLTVGLGGSEAVVDVSHLPGGELSFEVMVDDGFDTASAVFAALTLPHRPPVVAILSPAEGLAVEEGAPLRLWGAATDEAGNKLDDEACQWLLDGKKIADGCDEVIVAPAAGEHSLSLRATDSHGSGEASRTLVVVKPGATAG